MERAGRNDPCPCGSGRKFKKCCLPHEEERAIFVEALGSVAVPLLSRLAKFAQSVAGASLEAVAREDFPFWRGPLSRRQGARVVDHLMFDARTKQGGRRIVDLFEGEIGPTLDHASRAILARWSDAPRRLYRTISWSGGFTDCVDLIADDAAPISVFDIEESWRPAEGEAVALRPLSAGQAYFCAGIPIDYPKRDPAEVADRMRRRHLDYVRNERIVGIDDFLRLASTALDEESVRVPAASTIIVPGA
jgi:hypothetical protein